MVWARWRNTVTFKKIKEQGDSRNGMATVEFDDGSSEDISVNTLLWTSPMFKHGTILKVAGDMTRQYGVIRDTKLILALDDNNQHPFFTYLIDWGNWTVSDDNYPPEQWTGDKVTSTDRPRQKYLVGQLVDVQDWKTVIPSVRVVEYKGWNEKENTWDVKLDFVQGAGGAIESVIYEPGNWGDTAYDRPNDTIIDHWAKGAVEHSITTAGVAARGGTGLPLTGNVIEKYSSVDGAIRALANKSQWEGFEKEYANVEGVRIVPEFQGSIRDAIRKARGGTNIMPVTGVNWETFNRDFPMDSDPFQPGGDGLRFRGTTPVQEPPGVELTPPRPTDPDYYVRDPSRLPSRVDPKQLDFDAPGEAAPDGDFFNPGDGLGNLAAEGGEGLEMEEIGLLTGTSAAGAAGGVVAYVQGAAAGAGMTLGGVSMAAGAIGVVIAGGVGLYFLFDELFKNNEYNERWSEGITRLINTWKNEACYVFITVPGDKNGAKWWKANVTSVNINDEGIESWDLKGQINGGIVFTCNLRDAFSIMKQRDGPPVNARPRMYGYDFETAHRVEPRHYDIWDNIVNPFPSSVDYVWKVKFERNDAIIATGENTLEFLHPVLRIVADFDKRTFLVYVPSNSRRSLVAQGKFKIRVGGGGREYKDSDQVSERVSRGEVSYMHPPPNRAQDLEQAFGVYNFNRTLRPPGDPQHDVWGAGDGDHEQTEVERVWDAVLPFSGNTNPTQPAATLFHHAPSRPFRDEGPVIEPAEPESTETMTATESDLETTASMAAKLLGEPVAAQLDLEPGLNVGELAPDFSALSPGAPPAFGAQPDLLGLPEVPDNVDLGGLGGFIP